MSVIFLNYKSDEGYFKYSREEIILQSGIDINVTIQHNKL